MADERLNVRITARNESAGAFGQFRRQLSGVTSGLGTLKGAIAGAFAVAAVDRFARAVRSVVSETSTLGKVADRAGLATGEIQRLRFGFELLDVSADRTDKALAKFAINISEAARGVGELAPIIKANNVALRDGDGRLRSQSDLLRVFANLVRDTGSAQDRTNLAYKAFGRAGADLVLGLKDGEAGLRSLSREADRTGGVIEDRLVRRMEEVDDKIARIARTISFQFSSAIVTAVDKMDTFVTRFRGMARDLANSDFVRSLSEQTGILPVGPEVLEARGPSRRLGPRRRTPTVVPQSGGAGPRDTAAKAAQAQADKIKTVVDQLKFEAAQIGRTFEEQRLHNELRAAGVTLSTRQGQEISALVGEIGRLGQASEATALSQQQLNDAAQFFGDETLASILAITDRTETLDEVVGNLARSFAAASLQAALLGQGPLSNLFGSAGQNGNVGGAVGSILGAFGLPGFATGGQFRVGGSGGVDSQLVAFKASPDETVSVTRPGQSTGGNDGGKIVQNLTFNSGITPPDMARIRAEISRANTETRRLVQQDIRRQKAARSDAV